MPIQPEKWNSENLPVGPDTDPNDDTPAAVGLSTGGFALTWVRAGLGGALNTVQVRVYDAFGTPATALLTIDSNTSVGVFDPDIAAFPSGNFVVACRIGAGDISFGVRDVSGGLVLAPTALANSGATESDVALAYHTLDGAPSVLAVWEDSGGEDGAGYAIRGRYILANGTLSGAEFTINAQTAGDQLNPDIAASATGLNAIVWTDMNANSGDIKLRTVTNATGGPEIAEMTVNNSVTGLQDNASVVVLTTGVIVVGWESGTGVYFRVISAAGAFLTPDVLVSASGLDAQFAPTADGGFTIVYRQNGLDGSGGTLRMAAYDSTHTRVGLYITANTTTLNDQEEPDVAMLEDGRHILVFSDESTGANDDVRYQIIDSRTQTFAGSSGDDTLVGRATGMTFANDVISGFDGADLIYGLSGDDTLGGGNGNDSLFGDSGADFLVGGAGADELHGGLDSDTASYSGSGASVVINLAAGTASGDAGEAAGDVLTSIENLVGSAFADTLIGDGGANSLDGNGGADRLEGGLGDDRYFIRTGTETLVDTGGFDSHYVLMPSITSYALPSGFEILDISSSATIIIASGNGVDNYIYANAINSELYGNDGNDQLFGSVGNNRLEGGNGVDLLYGSDGDDALLGQIGIDRLEGEAGNDVLFAGEGDDSVLGGSGADNAFGENGNDLMFGGSGNDTMQGEFGDDRLFGEFDNDNLFGGVGNDELQGEQGDDRLWGDVGMDTLFGQDGNDELQGEGDNDRLFGGFGQDIMFGQDGNDEMQGEQDNDRLFGGFGADSMFGQDGNDEMQGEQDNDRMFGGAGLDSVFGQDGNDDMRGEADNDRMWGGAGADTVDGGSGADELHGEADADRITGGTGNDTMTGGGGGDLFIFVSNNDGADQANDFQDGLDLLDFRGTGVVFADINIVAMGANTLITNDDGAGSILLVNVLSTSISAADFLFV